MMSAATSRPVIPKRADRMHIPRSTPVRLDPSSEMRYDRPCNLSICKYIVSNSKSTLELTIFFITGAGVTYMTSIRNFIAKTNFH